MPDDPLSRSARGVYGITVASELSGFDPQTLRLYERRGLVTPARTDGGTRRYSDDDLDRLARISELVSAGVNISGILQILNLEHRNTELESDNSQLKSENERALAAMRGCPEFGICQGWCPHERYISMGRERDSAPGLFFAQASASLANALACIAHTVYIDRVPRAWGGVG